MSSDVPLKIQVEIMKRFPVKSLIRFKSVSKAWKRVIDSSKFIFDYNAACRHPQHCLVVTCPDYNSKDEYASIVDDDTFPLCKLSYTIPSNSFNLLDIDAIFGSSEGLFCFYGYKCGIGLMAVIWNPSIRKSVDIVLASKLNYRPPMNKFVVGFGVCPGTFDPMLVKITYIQTVDTLTGYNPTQVEVFILSSGAWKSRSANLPRESVQFPQDYCIDLDGFIHWLAIDKVDDESHNNMIMSFDMTSENFVDISLPDSLADAKNTYLSISKRMESLVVLERDCKAGKQVYKVWMMEGGIQKLFTNLFTIEAPEASVTRILGFRKNGKPIIAMYDSGSNSNKLGVYLYEPDSRHISYIGITKLFLRLVSSYKETLLLLDR